MSRRNILVKNANNAIFPNLTNCIIFEVFERYFITEFMSFGTIDFQPFVCGSSFQLGGLKY